MNKERESKVHSNDTEIRQIVQNAFEEAKVELLTMFDES